MLGYVSKCCICVAELYILYMCCWVVGSTAEEVVEVMVITATSIIKVGNFTVTILNQLLVTPKVV